MDIITAISEDLFLEKEYIINIIKNSRHYYRRFEIEKKNGGTRTIYQPSAELKTLQYWLLRNVFEKLPVSENAYAYCKGKSIVHNAQKHLANKFILYIDICSFFESINSTHLETVLNKHKNDFSLLDLSNANEIKTICDICLLNNHMTIGAVSSPSISNVIFYEIDDFLTKYCESKKYIYSRYADDIYISSDSFIQPIIINDIERNFKQYCFKINKKKTRFMSRNNKKIITGLILTSEKKLSIGLDKKKKLKKDIYAFLKHGRGDSEKIKGYLSFLKSVEPIYYDNIIIKYTKYGDVSVLL